MSAPPTCLLTGATGFIGGHVAQRLLDGGYSVRCLAREGSDTSLLEGLGVEMSSGDLTDGASLIAAAEGCRYVVHCGALVSDWATVQEIRRVNVDGTRLVLQAAVEASAQRFVHISSTDVYGHPSREVPIDETCPPGRFANWYSATKLAAEQEVRRAGDSCSLQTVIVRPATVYGPRSVGVLGEIAQALRSGTMLLVGRGRTIAGLCYVKNLADLVLLCISEQDAAGETFNASDGLDVTWKHLTDDLAEGIGASPARWSMPYPLASGLGLALEQGYRALRRTTGIKTRPLLSRQAVQVMGRHQSFSADKARRLLRWEPRVGYEEGLQTTIEWLRS